MLTLVDISATKHADSSPSVDNVGSCFECNKLKLCSYLTSSSWVWYYIKTVKCLKEPGYEETVLKTELSDRGCRKVLQQCKV